MQLKTKKIIALQGLIFFFSTIGWFILTATTLEAYDYSYKLLLFLLLPAVAITSGIINFIIWAIRVLLRKEERYK